MHPLRAAAFCARASNFPRPSCSAIYHRRTLCMPPFRGTLEASDDPLPTDQEAFDVKSTPDVSAADGITPEAALAELRRLRNNTDLTPADLGIHTPTPIAPFTDVDPVTGLVVGPVKRGFFSKKAA
ncbi:hypothetical protein CC85DRAFT_314015 [Cutaneotrichosporon oleaginosum]|uniref:Uncharacterized protein n=2 Tax=Cutaneotrichosporon oleaginosum TaxID=879819 RepID=A0A0J0XDP1_9TREE|nr:uncharacterized protein CC85DRAFT_314015 [Cutaneotrichosporon oleaginosum]KLT39201.1 hypothetical protein CC85DRAFT_314015 [Cutaneotrichosporon oleaginosum]